MSDSLSMPGFFIHHQLPELAQIHVHQVTDAIQQSHPLSSPSKRTLKTKKKIKLRAFLQQSLKVRGGGGFSH